MSDYPAPAVLVHEGQDGWLFLRGGSNFVTSLYSRDGGNLPDAQLSHWRKRIESRTARARALGIDCVHLVVPDKLTIYGDKQSEPLVDPEQAPAIRLAAQMRSSPQSTGYLDLVPTLRARRSETDLYWRTDSHWSPKGCHLAYLALCERCGLEPEPGLLARPHQTYQATMDLGGRLDPLRYEKVTKYDYLQKAKRVWINRITGYLEDPNFNEEIHVGARALFENAEARNNKRIMLIGDSYARPGTEALTGMLAETTTSLEFIWSSEIDWWAVRRFKPDILIVEIAERFLAVLAKDRRPQWLLEWRQMALARRRRRERARSAAAV
ncbi:MAG: hypothetical protein KGM42_12395 [Hyphomicrobiales bacterium]|nr:hypothetical protein [Hyphomicrobiales bacterium]